MDQITHDVRTAQWAEIVRKCHERPKISRQAVAG